VVPMIVSKRWRPLPSILALGGVVLVFSVILLTLLRGGLIFAVIGAATYSLHQQGQWLQADCDRHRRLGAAAWVGLDKIPNSERFTE